MCYYLDKGHLVKHSVIIISDDTKHDNHCVNEFRKQVINHIKASQNLEFNSIHEWTDGCAAQYKEKSSFADISRSDVELRRNFFETSHGKSVCGGIGAILKNACYRAVLSGKAVKGTALDVYNYLRATLTVQENSKDVNGQKEISRRNFLFVTDMVHERSEVNVNTVSGTRTFHVVKSWVYQT